MGGRRVIAICALAVAACSRPDSRVPQGTSTTRPTYDKTTGKLTQLTYDRNKDGVVDTWSDMDGAKPLQTRIDLDQDGTIDRWEYYDGAGQLVKVGFSRNVAGKPDAWAFSGPDGAIARVEASSVADEKKIDRWEQYAAGVMTRVEEDTNRDGRPDKWETYQGGAMKTVEFDENADGKPDRRLTYADGGGQLVLIETEPDASGRYTKKIPIQ